jgi:hypothetical protein
MMTHRATRIALLAVLAACQGVSRGESIEASGKATVYSTFIEGLVEMRVDLAVDGVAAERALVVSPRAVSRTGQEPRTTLQVGPGLHTYTLNGELTFEDGRKARMQGKGVVAWRESLWSELTSDSARRRPRDAMTGLLDAVGSATTREAPPTLRMGAAVKESSIAEAERRLGVRLPATYRRLLERFGPFAITGPDDDGRETPKAALYAPEAILSVPEWRARVRRSPLEAGDSPRARMEVAKLTGDFVIGHAFDTVWVVRARTHAACPNGEPSLSGEFLYEVGDGEDIWNEDTDAYSGYFGDREPKCGDRAPVLHDGVMGVLLEELSGSKRLALVGDSRALALQYEGGPSGAATLFLTSSAGLR